MERPRGESEQLTMSTPEVKQSRPVSAYRRSRSHQALRREGDVMGLTVCVALLAALATGNDFTPHSKLDVLMVVWGTTVGLALAHWFALLVSIRLVPDSTQGFSPLELLVAQTAMVALVAISASVSVLVLSSDYDRLGARVTAALFIGGLVAWETKRSAWTTSRRLVWSGGVTALGLMVAITKWVIS